MPQSCYVRNLPQLKGPPALYRDNLQQLGLKAVFINKRIWRELPNHKKSSYLNQLVEDAVLKLE